jgi:hypothetical protein
MHDDPTMRTTLEIDDDVLLAAKEIGDVQGLPAGKVISNLARKGLSAPKRPAKTRNGVPLLPRQSSGARKPTMKLVNELRDAG